MARARGVAALLFSGSTLLFAVAGAHHSSAMYDDKTTVTVDGTVSKFEWANPHVYIYVRQMTGADRTLEWQIEGSPPSILRRLGWSKDTLHVGDKISVTGHPARDAHTKSLVPTSIKRGDTTLFDRPSEVQQLARADAAPTPARTNSGLDGIWVTLLNPQVEDLLDPDKLSLTPKGAVAVKHFDENRMHPGARCVPFPAPVLMITPDLKRVTKGDGVIYIDGEFDGARRTIHMNAPTHEGASDSIQGHSIGRWRATAW